jgi:hypothetical protein
MVVSSQKALILALSLSLLIFSDLSTFLLSWYLFILINKHIKYLVHCIFVCFGLICGLHHSYAKSIIIDYNWCKFDSFFFISFQIRLSDLIAARILRYTDFDTLIYTCAPEFDFMEQAV